MGSIHVVALMENRVENNKKSRAFTRDFISYENLIHIYDKAAFTWSAAS